MKLDPDCDVCDDNGMWCDPDKIMDVPCPSCNAEPVTDSMLRSFAIDEAKASHPSSLPSDIVLPDPETLRAASELCMEFGKQMLQAAMYTAETLENAARQFVEWSEAFTLAANSISEPTDGDISND